MRTRKSEKRKIGKAETGKTAAPVAPQPEQQQPQAPKGHISQYYPLRVDGGLVWRDE